MNRKVYKAENIQQAIATIKEELGSDAMILSTRKIKRKLSDPYAKEMFEVEAAVPPAPRIGPAYCNAKYSFPSLLFFIFRPTNPSSGAETIPKVR